MLLQHLGHTVQCAASGEEALGLFDAVYHTLVITDFLMPGMSGDDLAAALKVRSPATPIILYSASPGVCLDHADSLISKPASLDEFRRAVESVASSRTRPSRSGLGPRDAGPFPAKHWTE